jgi:hypothetical protein
MQRAGLKRRLSFFHLIFRRMHTVSSVSGQSSPLPSKFDPPQDSFPSNLTDCLRYAMK